MNWVDWVLIVVFAYYIFDGYRRGFIELALELISFLISVFVAIQLDQTVGDLIASKVTMPETFHGPVGFIVVWIVVQVIFSIIIMLGNRFIPPGVRKSIINRLTGILPSIAKALILVAVILLIIMSLPLSGDIKKDVTGSAIGDSILNNSTSLKSSYQGLFGDSIGEMTTLLTKKPSTSQILEPNERLDLGFKVTDTKIDEISEGKMLELVNKERVSRGLGELRFDPFLLQVARAHADDMFRKGYFSHTNLEGLDPFDRMRNAGVIYKIAGENLALAPDVNLAHNGLMNSPGHRANILETRFGRAGIGVIDGGIYGKMFVQEFRD